MYRTRIHILVLVALVSSSSQIAAKPHLASETAPPHSNMQSHADHTSADQSEPRHQDDCCNAFGDRPSNKEQLTHQCDEPCYCAVNSCAETQVYPILSRIIYALTEPGTRSLTPQHNLHEPYRQRPERIPIA
jgi:hypothetical protein